MDAVKIWQSLRNAWATSRRCYEDVLLICLSGCKHQHGDLVHYMQCPHLFDLRSFLTESVSNAALNRWGLIKLYHKFMIRAASVYFVYIYI